jgi:transposase
MPKILPLRITTKGVTARLHKPVAWRPMTDAEWDQMQFIFAWLHPDRGRPLANPRMALDACFHAACSDKPWRELPPVFGKWQTIHRLFVRWTHKGAWSELLKFVACGYHQVPASVTWWICKAFRRARRIMGIKGIMLARRLGMDSALPAPSWFLPDPIIWDYSVEVWLPRLGEKLREKGRGSWSGGRSRISRWMAPEYVFPGMHTVPGGRMAA